MNTHITKLSALTGAFIFALGSLHAQNKEYDDLYFNANDRLKVKEVKAENRIVQDTREVRQLTASPVESYSAKNINPEFLARYQAPADNGTENAYSEDEYFDEDYNNVTSNYNNYNNNDHDDVVIRDRYGNTAYFDDFSDVYWSDPFYFEGSIFDPFYSPYRYGFHRYGFGYRPFRSGLSFGFGNLWGSGWYSHFSFGYGWGSGFYNPFYDPFYASYYNPFHYPYYGSYYGYGYPYRNNYVIINNYESRTDRSYRRGPGTSRSANIATGNRSRRVVSVDNDVSTGRSSSTSRVATDNDPSAQGRYYRRSREAVINNDGAAATSRTYESRSRSSSNYSTNSRSSSRSSYSRPSNDDYDYNRSRSRSDSRSYSSPSRSRSSNYSTGRSSRSSSYSAPSRSRSSSYSTGSSSRSSSGTRSSSSSRSRRGGR